MTKLFVLDLDGCVTHPFVTPDWQSISQIREYNLASRYDKSIPPLSICTGRPFPYAEAVAQWLDIKLPIIFESGGGVYFPDKQVVEFSPTYYQNEQKVADVRSWIKELIRTDFPDLLLEFSKQTDAGIVHNDESKIMEVYNRAVEYVGATYPDFEVHRTEVSVNIILKECNKGNGLRRISEITGISLADIAYIGDSSGDIPALKIVGKPYTPANGNAQAQKVARQTKGETSIGVLEAYEELINENRAN